MSNVIPFSQALRERTWSGHSDSEVVVAYRFNTELFVDLADAKAAAAA